MWTVCCQLFCVFKIINYNYCSDIFRHFIVITNLVWICQTPLKVFQYNDCNLAHSSLNRFIKYTTLSFLTISIDFFFLANVLLHGLNYQIIFFKDTYIQFIYWNSSPYYNGIQRLTQNKWDTKHKRYKYGLREENEFIHTEIKIRYEVPGIR